MCRDLRLDSNLGHISAKYWWILPKYGSFWSWRSPAVLLYGSGDPRTAGEAAVPRVPTGTGSAIADTAAIVQPNWELELQRENKRKLHKWGDPQIVLMYLHLTCPASETSWSNAHSTSKSWQPCNSGWLPHVVPRRRRRRESEKYMLRRTDLDTIYKAMYV